MRNSRWCTNLPGISIGNFNLRRIATKFVLQLLIHDQKRRRINVSLATGEG
jgi:hypothetical protein